jgi:peroxiredoxin
MIYPGNQAPDINLPDLEGTAFQLRKALEQGPVVLAFFKISCPTCQMTFPFLQRLADAPATDAQLIAISQDTAEDSREFHQRVGVSMRTLVDARPGYAVSNAYGISNVPSLFVVERDGTISAAADGFNKAAIEGIASLFGVKPFRETDHVPSLRPG